jgi:GATA-binding protein
MVDDHAVPSKGHHSLWQGLSHQSLPFNGSRGSLLGELYDHDLTVEQSNIYDHPNDAGEWPPQLPRPLHHPPQDLAAGRRATYPYVRQDRDASAPYSQAPFMPQDCEPMHGSYSRADTLYGEPLPLMDNSPQLISIGPDNHSFHHGHYDVSVSSSPASSYVEFENLDHNVKLEESAPVIVPSQTCLYRPPSSGAIHPMSYLPHTGLPVQHTDDAASKETQYLRRRCFNCSQTEPPSWRRSTLNPGKIVCNKCGLYERTHLRPRPLRFDELRTGNKSRKQSKSASGSAAKLLKKEVEAQAMSRRASVSSSSSVHSSSDWDDSGSVTNILTHSSVLTKLLKCLFILRGRHRHRRTTLPLSLALPCHWNVLRSRHL